MNPRAELRLRVDEQALVVLRAVIVGLAGHAAVPALAFLAGVTGRTVEARVTALGELHAAHPVILAEIHALSVRRTLAVFTAGWTGREDTGPDFSPILGETIREHALEAQAAIVIRRAILRLQRAGQAKRTLLAYRPLGHAWTLRSEQQRVAFAVSTGPTGSLVAARSIRTSDC
jgi:hypothetical protein